MRDPRHELDAKNQCTRCGLGKRWGEYCPVGFWASAQQHKILDATGETDRLEREWLAEWRAGQAPRVAKEKP